VRYEIRIRGRLSGALAAEFERLAVAATEPIETLLQGSFADRAALHDFLRHIEGLGLELVEMRGSLDDAR
jgi:hypothetical protein